MRCPNCKQEIPDDARFCPFCGGQFGMTPEEPVNNTVNEPVNTNYKVPVNHSYQTNTQSGGGVYLPPPDGGKKKKDGNKLPIIVTAISLLVIIFSVIFILKSGIVKISIGNDSSEKGTASAVTTDGNTQTAGNTEDAAAQTTENAEAAAQTAENAEAAAQAAENVEDTANIPAATATPLPTATPVPTATPLPTNTPTPLPTETPIPAVYIPEVITIYDGIQANASDFLFPESSSEYLTNARMNEVMESSDSNMMHKLSQLAINELLARYGFTFTSSSQTAQDARDQFEGKGWYESVQRVCPSNQWDVLRANYFNSYERANFDALNQWQKDHGVYY